jgi:hypothetical protein
LQLLLYSLDTGSPPGRLGALSVIEGLPPCFMEY